MPNRNMTSPGKTAFIHDLINKDGRDRRQICKAAGVSYNFLQHAEGANRFEEAPMRRFIEELGGSYEHWLSLGEPRDLSTLPQMSWQELIGTVDHRDLPGACAAVRSDNPDMAGMSDEEIITAAHDS